MKCLKVVCSFIYSAHFYWALTMFRNVAGLKNTEMYVKTVETLKQLTWFINRRVLHRCVAYSLMIIICAVIIMHANSLFTPENINVVKLYPSQADMFALYICGRTPPREPSAKLLYSSGQLMSSLSLVTVLGMEDTQKGQTSLPSWSSQSSGDTDSKRAMMEGLPEGYWSPEWTHLA